MKIPIFLLFVLLPHIANAGGKVTTSDELAAGPENRGMRLGLSVDTSTLDAILHADIHPKAFIASDTYKAQRDKIREELVAKLGRMIREGEYHKILDYLFFIVDISDKRYVPLMRTIEKRLGSSAGVNLIGYSEFLELKISNAAGETVRGCLKTSK